MGQTENSPIPPTADVPDVRPSLQPHARVSGLRWVNMRETIRFELFHPRRELTLGRAPQCDIVVPPNDTHVSTVHCVFQLGDRNIWTVHDQSRNGTFIYRAEDPFARRVGKSAPAMLSLNMEIIIHNHRFVPIDSEGKIGIFATTQEQLRARAFDYYGDALEAGVQIGVSKTTIYRAYDG
ncbi:MAG: FHA domain-containing protein [Proteobacteria bacterium]|nr:FHA domain-containing protein [Pseudomonadota bacterium]